MFLVRFFFVQVLPQCFGYNIDAYGERSLSKLNIVSDKSEDVSAVPDGLALNFRIASNDVEGTRESEGEEINFVNHNVNKKQTFIISEDHLRENIQLERTERNSQKLNPTTTISTFVLSSFIGGNDDDIINICLADDLYPAVEITNSCAIILALREMEEGTDVSKHYPVLENQMEKMLVLKPNSCTPFVPARFKANFPKLANPVEFYCQLALYTSPGSCGGGGVELSKPVKVQADNSDSEIIFKNREEEVYIPSFGHVRLEMSIRNAQLFVNISSDSRSGGCSEQKQKTDFGREELTATPSFDVKVSSVDIILIDRVNSSNPKETDAVFSVSASHLCVSHSKLRNTIDNQESRDGGNISTQKTQNTDNGKCKENDHSKESSKEHRNNISRPTETTASELLISLGSLQVDNQIHDDVRFHFPVVLLPMRNIAQRYHTVTDHAPFADLQASDDTDFLTLRCVVTSSSSVISIDDVTLDIQPFEMSLEDVFVYKLLNLTKRYLPKLGNSKKLARNDRLAAIKPVLYPWRISRIRISEISFLLSIHASVKVFLAADHIPLRLGAFQCQPTQTIYDEFARAVLYHYATQVLVRAGWIVGSLELIGNPTGFIHKLGQGISDFVTLPYHGLTRGPTAFVTGISQGLSSFVRHASTGTLTSITNVSSSISRNLDRLCLDETHMRLQEERRAQVPLQTMSGISSLLFFYLSKMK